MNNLKKILAVVLVTALCVCSFASCSASKTAMNYDGETLSEYDYAYVMAFIKGYYEAYYEYVASYYGVSYTLDDLWDMEVSDGVTFEEEMLNTVTQTAQMMIVVEKLCKDFGISVTDESTIADITDAIQELEDDYGGEDALNIELAKLGLKKDSIERYEYYNALLSLLKEYRYGDSGVAKISEEEVRNSFDETYLKAEGYCYSFLDSSSSMRTYDFSSVYSEEDVLNYFTENYIKIMYLTYSATDEETAKETCEALKAGTAQFSDYFSSVVDYGDETFINRKTADPDVYTDIFAADEDTWMVCLLDDGYYVLKYTSAKAEELEDVEEDIRDAMFGEEAYDYFLENYVTVGHILYDDEETAKSVYEDILAGNSTFADHESETEDSSIQYTFTRGTMVEEFEEESYRLNVGEIGLIQSDYGWHIIERRELDTSAYDEDDANASMTRDMLEEEATKMFADLESGVAVFETPSDDALYTYSEATLLEKSDLDSGLVEAIESAEEGEIFMKVVTGSGVYILQKVEMTDDDLESVYDDVESPLITEAFYDYLNSFFDSITVNQDVLDQFNIRTANTFYY